MPFEELNEVAAENYGTAPEGGGIDVVNRSQREFDFDDGIGISLRKRGEPGGLFPGLRVFD